MIRALTALFRVKLSLLNGVSAACGFLLTARHGATLQLLAACGGVFLLAAGGSALNQLLDRDIDARMLRTAHRPLPTGALSISHASVAGCSTIVAGLCLLATSGTILPPLLGSVALVIYLAIYTPLKRHTPLALPLGALCGSIPPLIGWCLAGGEPGNFRIIILCGLFFIWQMPHFWLLQTRHKEDYRRAGLPLFEAGHGLLLLWIAALSAALLLIPLFGLATLSPWSALFPLLLVLLAMLKAERKLFACLSTLPLLLSLLLLLN
jgi:protoheme IX farnesyltransferase